MFHVVESGESRGDEKAMIAGFLAYLADRLEKPREALSARKLVAWEVVDFEVFDGDNPCALVECKRRRCRIGEYDAYMISRMKWDEGLKRARDKALPFFLLVRFDDADVFIYADEWADSPVLRYGKGGRHDRAHRNIASDVEEMVYIPRPCYRIIPGAYRNVTEIGNKTAVAMR